MKPFLTANGSLNNDAHHGICSTDMQLALEPAIDKLCSVNMCVDIGILKLAAKAAVLRISLSPPMRCRSGINRSHAFDRIMSHIP